MDEDFDNPHYSLRCSGPDTINTRRNKMNDLTMADFEELGKALNNFRAKLFNLPRSGAPIERVHSKPVKRTINKIDSLRSQAEELMFLMGSFHADPRTFYPGEAK